MQPSGCLTAERLEPNLLIVTQCQLQAEFFGFSDVAAVRIVPEPASNMSVGMVLGLLFLSRRRTRTTYRPANPKAASSPRSFNRAVIVPAADRLVADQVEA